MLIFQPGQSEELKRGVAWWNQISFQWKMAFNEAVFGKGPTLEPPKDEELILLLTRATVLRFAGPMAVSPNLSHIPDDLSAIAGLPHLTFLTFTDSKLTSLLEIKHLTQLQHLFVYRNELTSLAGIENMVNLVELYCQENQITSIEPVRNLTNLHTLYVTRNKITSLEGITAEHEAHLREFRVLPNEQLKHREVIRIQNEYGILCKNG